MKETRQGSEQKLANCHQIKDLLLFGKSGVKIKETNNYYFSLLLCFNEFNKKFSFSSKIIGVINI